jgi:hypothetical protein
MPNYMRSLTGTCDEDLQLHRDLSALPPPRAILAVGGAADERTLGAAGRGDYLGDLTETLLVTVTDQFAAQFDVLDEGAHRREWKAGVLALIDRHHAPSGPDSAASLK